MYSQEFMLFSKFTLELEIAEKDAMLDNDSLKLKRTQEIQMGGQHNYSRDMIDIYDNSRLSNSSKYYVRVKNSVKNEFTIKCQMEFSSKQKFFPKMSGFVGPQSLSKNIGQLLDSQDYSDFTFVVSGKEFKAHKNILSVVSPYFATLFRSDFKENENNVLQNKENPEIFQNVLEFIYKGKLPENLPDVAMDLYGMAHLYQIEDLMKCCHGHIYDCQINKKNVFKIYKFAAEYEVKKLFELSWMFMKM